MAEKFERQQAEARASAANATSSRTSASPSNGAHAGQPSAASTPTAEPKPRSLLDEHSVLSVVQSGVSTAPAELSQAEHAATNGIPNMMWDASTTTTSDGEPGDKTLAMPKDAAEAVWAAVAQATSPASARWSGDSNAEPSEPLPPAPMNVRDKTIPIYQVPAHLAAHMASAPPVLVPPPQHPPQPDSNRDTEGTPSQVTSVTLTTTGLPPPIPKEHVKRLTMIAAITGGVSVLVVSAILVIVTKLRGDSSSAKTNSSQLVTTRTTTEARPVSASAVPPSPALSPPPIATPAPTPEPPAASSTPEASSAPEPSASAPAPVVSSAAPPPPTATAPRPPSTSYPVPPPKRTNTATTSRPFPTSTAKPKGSSKPRR